MMQAVTSTITENEISLEAYRASPECSALLSEAHAVMVEYMSGYDPSHDVLHVERVVRMARRISDSIPGTDSVVVELGALFHDLIDHKYLKSQTERDVRINRLLDLMLRNGLDEARAQLVIKIVQNTGFSIEKRLRAQGNWTEWHQTCTEFHCVQDGDRLDAIGAMGIFRVSAYAEHAGNPLFHTDPKVPSAYQHFFDKLLTLKNTLKTPLGREVGDKRQQIMEDFVSSALQEYELNDFN